MSFGVQKVVQTNQESHFILHMCKRCQMNHHVHVTLNEHRNLWCTSSEVDFLGTVKQACLREMLQDSRVSNHIKLFFGHTVGSPLALCLVVSRKMASLIMWLSSSLKVHWYYLNLVKSYALTTVRALFTDYIDSQFQQFPTSRKNDHLVYLSNFNSSVGPLFANR